MAERGPHKILVLDDDSGILMLLKRALERAGYRVVGASTLAEAETALMREDAGIDLIVLDYNLSGTQSGLEFFRTLSGRGVAPPSILATGFSDEKRVLEALRAGVRDVVRKGEDFLEMIPRTVGRVLREVETERKALEAEAASRAKDHFLAVLSHELRTPLTPVLTVAQEKERDTTLTPDVREAFSMIRRNIQLEARLIDDLLDLTRISRGKLDLHTEPVKLHEKIVDVVRMVESEARAKGLTMQLDLEAKRYCVPADPTRLQQVLWNLLRNAIKFTPEGGSIRVRTLDVEGSERVRTEITDTGIGIAAEALPKIFDAFEQGERFITRQFGGLGLGLAITKALVELHGGNMGVASEGLGRGATFSFELTGSVPEILPSGSEPKRPVTLTSQQTLSILLVEDHPDTARALARLLKVFGHEVRIADSVGAALQAVAARPFDLLISDLGLPDGTGLDLMRQMRQSTPMRAIVLSGFGMEEDVRRSLRAGFAAHLTKPVSFAQLELTIARVMSMDVPSTKGCLEDPQKEMRMGSTMQMESSQEWYGPVQQ